MALVPASLKKTFTDIRILLLIQWDGHLSGPVSSNHSTQQSAFGLHDTHAIP